MDGLETRDPDAPIEGIPRDHVRMQEMPLSSERLNLWADLYQDHNDLDLSSSHISHLRHTSAPKRSELDNLAPVIHETDLLCRELDRLRSLVLFANTELTELRNLLSIEECEEQRSNWKDRYIWCNKRQQKQRHQHQQHISRKDTNHDITIREAVDTDIAALDVFARRSFRETFFEPCGYTEEDLQRFYEESYSPQAWQDLLQNPKRHVLVAYTHSYVDSSSEEFVKGALVGYACVGGPTELPVPLAEEERQRCGDLLRCYIDRATFGTGLAKRLVDAGLRWLLPRFPGDVYIGVWSGNLRAQQFYKKYGAKVVHEYLFPVGDKNDHELVMRCDRADIEDYMCSLGDSWPQEPHPREVNLDTSLDLSVVQGVDVESVDSDEVLTAIQCLHKFEKNKLRPLLQDLAKLKWKVFTADYETLESQAAAAAQVSPSDEVPRTSSAAYIYSTTIPMQSYEQPHHFLFLEHLGLFINALLLGAKVAEIHHNWDDCACIYAKVIDFMHYSGRYSDHTGISVHDLIANAQRRYAINAVSASGCPSPPRRLGKPSHKLSVACNLDISRVCVWCANAHFSAGNMTESKEMAVRALQGLALAEPTISGSNSRGHTAVGMGKLNAFDRSHTDAPSVMESLAASKKGLPRPLVSFTASKYNATKLAYDQTYGEAHALLRFFSSLEFKHKHTNHH